MQDQFTVLESKAMYESDFVKLYNDKIKSPSGRILSWDVVKRPNGVGIIALNKNKEMVFVRQYRHPVGVDLLEIPAGLLQDKEDPSSCAIRELKEETGYTAKKVEKIAEIYTSAGFADEKLHIYFTDEVEEGEPELEPGEEDIRMELFSLKDAVDMVAKGEIMDAKTVIAILMVEKKLG